MPSWKTILSYPFLFGAQQSFQGLPYCWWFRNPANGKYTHCLRRVLAPSHQVGFSPDFWTISSFRGGIFAGWNLIELLLSRCLFRSLYVLPFCRDMCGWVSHGDGSRNGAGLQASGDAFRETGWNGAWIKVGLTVCLGQWWGCLRMCCCF